MKIDAKLDFERVPRGEPVALRLMVALHPEPRAATAPRRALNLAVVLDRSGSMSGGKLEDVKEAARSLVRCLGPDDVFSLAAFDDEVYPLLPPASVRQQGSSAEAAIDGLVPGGSTDLCGGYQQGGAFARIALADDRTSRVLLLTDGLANHGIVEPAGIAEVVDRFRSEGIGTSTVGVGAGYNEELLGLMAERGGGSTYFLRNASEAVEVFREELGDLISVDAADVVVRFVPRVGGLRVGQLNTFAAAGELAWRLGDLFGSRPRYLVLEIEAAGLEPGPDGRVDLGRVEIAWRKAAGAGFEAASAALPVALGFASPRELEGAAPDREVTLQAAYLVAARALAGAMTAADAGGFEEAARGLEECAGRLESLGLGDALLDSRLRDLRDRARQLRVGRDGYYDPMERKRMHASHQYLSKSIAEKLSVMEGRHARHGGPSGGRRSPGAGTGRGAEYSVYSVNGHLLAEIGDDRVLIDTGSPTSIGEDGAVTILGRSHRVGSEFMGATIDDLGTMVGTRITVLLGADVLSLYDLRVDLEAGKIAMTEDELDLGLKPVPVRLFQGVPIVEASLDGIAQPFFFDTGAKLSYLHSSLAGTFAPTRTETDFFPGFGEFEVQAAEVPIVLGGREYRMWFGTLPRILEMSLLLAGVNGILGSALCEGSVITYAPRRKGMSISSS